MEGSTHPTHHGDNASWLHSCNLCWSLDYERIEDRNGSLHACRVCGLVQRADHQGPINEGRMTLDSRIFRQAVGRLASRVQGTERLRLLVLGPVEGLGIETMEKSGISVTVHTGRLDSASFPPDTFDIILCSRPIEYTVSPSDAFSRSRTWLKPEGLFLVGGINWGSIERRLWSERWLSEYSSGCYYLSIPLMKVYATRFGFELLTSGTSTSLGSIARVAYGNASLFTRIAAMPFGLISLFPRLGTSWWGIMMKRGLATRPIPDREEEVRADASVLAPVGSYLSPRAADPDRWNN